MWLSHTILSLIILSLFQKHAYCRRFGTSYYLEDMDEAYYDMGASMGQGITKVDWQMERKLMPKKGTTTQQQQPNLNEKCSLKFLSSSNRRRRGSEVVLFSTGEVGYWKIKNPTVSSNVLTASYNKALASLSRSIEIEVPSSSSSDGDNGNNDDGVLVYTLTLGAGTVQPLAVLARGKGSVKYYPKGRSPSAVDQGDDSASAVDIGNCEMHVKSGRPIVDAQFSKGRRWWWTARERPGMKWAGL